ncbi:MAG: type II secretion system-associated lipoprotein [Leptospiraceae bacterium]|nr:type II secretion system-associated lipoprotein [Leptospiraceae bacterium]
MKTFLLISIMIFSLFCQRRVLKKDDIAFLNEYYGKKTYYLKQDVQINNKEVLKKGLSVKIWIESTSSLLKVKCYPSNADRESALGKMVNYLINEDLKNKQLTMDGLDDFILAKLEEYGSKNKIKPGEQAVPANSKNKSKSKIKIDET